jgi:hypothetical protein
MQVKISLALLVISITFCFFNVILIGVFFLLLAIGVFRGGKQKKWFYLFSLKTGNKGCCN